MSHCLIVQPFTLDRSSLKNIITLYLSQSGCTITFSLSIKGGVVSCHTTDTSIVVILEYPSVSTASNVSDQSHTSFQRSDIIISVISFESHLYSVDQIILSLMLIETLLILFGDFTLNQTIGFVDIFCQSSKFLISISISSLTCGLLNSQ